MADATTIVVVVVAVAVETTSNIDRYLYEGIVQTNSPFFAFNPLITNVYPISFFIFVTIPAYIDELVSFLHTSGVKNASMYSPGKDPAIGGLFNGDENLPYDEAIQWMKEFYVTKYNWFDNWINEL